MKKNPIIHSLFAFAFLATAGCAQTPPPPAAVAPPAPNSRAATPPAPPPAGGPAAPQMSTAAAVTETGPIRYVIYGPQRDVQFLILRNDRIVNVPPELGAQMRMTLSEGASVSVTGIPQYFGRQRQLIAQSMQVNGQRFVSAAPAGLAPAPPAGPAPGQQPPSPRGAPQPPRPGAQPTPPPPPPQ